MKFNSLSIRLKLVIASGALLALVIGVIAVMVSSLMYGEALNEAQNRSEALLAQYNATISGEIGQSVEAAISTANAIEGMLNRPELTRDLVSSVMLRALEGQPDAVGMALAFNPNALDGRDADFTSDPLYPEGRFISYFFRQSNGGLGVEPLDMSPGGGSGDWFDTPMAANRTLITPSYIYSVDGSEVLMTTVSAVVRDNGRAAGIVTVDLDLADISAFTNQLSPFGDGSVFLIGTGTTWISHARPDLIGMPADDELATAMTDPQRRGAIYAFTGSDGIARYAMPTEISFDGVDETWTLVMTVPQATIWARADAIRNLIAIAGVLAMIVVMGVVWVGAGLISRPIVRMTDLMGQMAKGNLDIDVPYAENKDEIGAMAAAVEVFRQNGLKVAQMTEAEAARIIAQEQERRAMMGELQSAFGDVVDAAVAGDFSRRVETEFPDAELNGLASSVNNLVATVDRGISETGAVLSALARTDLTQRITGDYQGALLALKTDTNRVADTLTDVVGKLRVTSGTVKTATSEILSGANDLSERTTKQAATIEETSAAMEQLASTVSANATRAQDASRNSEAVTRTAQEGGEVMAEANRAMERISTSSAKVSDIIGMIDNIAFQTNLLALNASVEAARAGEAGKGFAVVAIEVRRLAQSAAQASAEVKALIEQSGNEVTGGSKLVAEAAQKLSAMLEAAKANNEIIIEIAQQSREQATAIDEVSTAVRQLDEMTQHNAALVEETNAAIEQTEAQASELDRIVAIFKLETGAARETAKPERASRPAPAPKTRQAARAYLTQGSAAVSSDWDEF